MKKTITIEIEVVPDDTTATRALDRALDAVDGGSGVKVVRYSCVDTKAPPQGSKMKLQVLLAKFPDSDVPEVVRCWDEYCRDGNPDGYEKDMASGRKLYGDFAEYRHVVVNTVGLPEVFDTPEIAGELE